MKEIILSNHLCISIWPVQIHKIVIWSRTSWQHDAVKKDGIFKDASYVFGIAIDILVVGHDDDCRDHNGTLKRVMQLYCN